MVAEPVAHVRAAARALLEAGATLVAGHSAHVSHGVDRCVLYDLGDFLDDYAVDPKLRNDLGLLFLVDLDGNRLEAIPLKLEFAHTRPCRRRRRRVGAAPLPRSLRGVRDGGGRRGQALRQVLGRAVEWRMIDVNPAKHGVNNPQRRRTKKRPFESWAQLAEVASRLGERERALVIFAAATGR